MYFPMILVALMQYPVLEPTIDFIDSRDDSSITYIIVTHNNKTCKVPILKKQLRDYDKIISVVLEKCGL